MPGMPKTNKKAIKIAEDIMGIQPNKDPKKGKGNKERDARLTFEETIRVR